MFAKYPQNKYKCSSHKLMFYNYYIVLKYCFFPLKVFILGLLNKLHSFFSHL